MRLIVSVLSASFVAAALIACTTETIYVPAQPSSADGGASSDAGTRPLPSSGGAKDAGSKPKPDTQPPTATKPTTCRTAAQCIGDCDGQDDSCTDKCFGALPDDELAELHAVSLCIGNSGCADDACVQETCAAEIETCLAD
jgi:hypothetical protein